MLQRHIVAERHIPCGKESKQKLEQGPVDPELDVRCKVYENGRVAADPETFKLLKQFSEREKMTDLLHGSRIRLPQHGERVTRRTDQKTESFLRTELSDKRVD